MSKEFDRRNVAITRLSSRNPSRNALDVLSEERMLQNLERFQESPGIASQFIERARTRFQKAGERAIVAEWTTLYESAQRLMATKLALERQKSEYLLLGYDHDIKVRERTVNLCKLEAEIEEHHLRRDKATYQREHVERFVEGAICNNINEDEAKLNHAHARRLLDARWELHESLRALHTLVELQHWRRQQRDGILRDRSLSEEESTEDLQFIDDLYEQKRTELRVDTRIFEGM